MDFNSWNIVWSLCFGLLATSIAVGNVLTIWIFLKQRLRKRAHFLLINLAVADLLVGLLSAPLFVVINAATCKVRLAELVFTYADVFTGGTSIYTLTVISSERMYAVGWPFRYRTLNFRVYMFSIAILWILAAILTSKLLLIRLSIITPSSFLFPLIWFQSTPFLVMCAAYCVIWKKQKSPIKTLFIITGASILTWFPFKILNLLAHFGVTSYFPHIHATFYIIKFLQFSNSLVNVIIYPFRISEFKNALLQMFYCCVIPCQRGIGNDVDPIPQVRVGQLHPCQELRVIND